LCEILSKAPLIAEILAMKILAMKILAMKIFLLLEINATSTREQRREVLKYKNE
jgi:hypothetical protein